MLVRPSPRVETSQEAVPPSPSVKRAALCLFMLSVVLLAALLFALCRGSVPISLPQVIDILHHAESTTTEATVLREIRLPRSHGHPGSAALSLAGTAFQGILRNPLADPYIVGTSAGAALGAAVALVMTQHGFPISVPLLAFIGGLATMAAVTALTRRQSPPRPRRFCSGVVVGSFLWAAVSFLLTTSRQQGELLRFLMGDLSSVQFVDGFWQTLPLIAIGAAALWLLSHRLNLLTLGEDPAFHLGVPVEAVKLTVIAIASLLTAAAVSVSGLIGFVGLMVPHSPAASSARITAASSRPPR